MILTPLQKLPKNGEDWGKLIVAKGFKTLSKVQNIGQSSHTGHFLLGLLFTLGGKVFLLIFVVAANFWCFVLHQKVQASIIKKITIQNITI